jgi:D-alanyl-D-alanine carboxypeptidase/D-alanyl-D-alanine-endopeptidase (penicillin-binding protein 4)
MDPRRGRRTTFPAARLALIAAFALLLVVLRQAVGGGVQAESVDADHAAAGAPDGGGGVAGVAGVAGSAAALAPLPEGARATAQAAVDAIVARWMKRLGEESRGKAGAANTVVAVHAIELDAERGGLLVSRNADASLLPASNMKLVTSIAALRRLTPSWSFTTRVVAGGPVEADGTLRGDLVVRAGADPLTDDAGTGAVEARLDALARDVAASGVRRVSGALVLDEGTYAAPAPAPGWPDAAQLWADYCALPGGLTVNGGVLRATLRPNGAHPHVVVHPAPHGLRENYAVQTGAGNDVRVGATATSCTVKGELPAANVAAFEASFAHPDPVLLFGSVFAASLARAGVKVDGGVSRRRNAAPADAPVLAELRSSILSGLVPINTHSANGVAEQLFLALGDAAVGDGTRAGGMRAVQQVLREMGIPIAGYAQADGSGLSRDNRATARQLTALLEAAWRMPAPVRDAFFGSLAVAGETGTLADRLRGTGAAGRVRAKTGWISGASALTGIARADGERVVLFSILVSYPRELGGLNTRVFKPMQDELVLALLEGER